MRRFWIRVVCSTAVLAACSGSSGHVSPVVTGTQPPPVTASTTTTLAATPSSAAATTTTATTVACANHGSTTPVTTPQSQSAALLSEVAITTSGCRDLVVFRYVAKGGAPPSCKIDYESGPFTRNASGAPLTIAGAAFVVVRCSPAYGYDFETNRTTYVGPEHLSPSGTHHVREVAAAGDSEGVLRWVIGLDARRGFSVASSGTPMKQLVITFS
jgi:hypothetical protein